jgi:flagellar biosynthesis protein FlhB
MEPLTLTLLIGIGALVVIWLVTVLLIWRWFKLSERAVLKCLYDPNINAAKMDKELARLKRYATVIRYLKVFTIEIPFMLVLLVLGLITNWLF